MEVLGIIPARGSSKSIPLKNIRIIIKKHLISYTINTAIKSEVFDYILMCQPYNYYIKNKNKIIKMLDKNGVLFDLKNSFKIKNNSKIKVFTL